MKIGIALFVTVVTALAYIAVPAFLLVATGDYQGSSSLYGATEDSALVNFLLSLHTTIVK